MKNLPAWLREITSNHNGDFYCLNCFHSYNAKNTLRKHEKVCYDHYYCYVEIPKEDNKILKYSHGEKSLRVPFKIYSDSKYLLEKILMRLNNLDKSYTEREAKDTPSGYSWCTICSFYSTKNKYGYYRGEDCIERLCKRLRDLALEIINYKKKNQKKQMIPLTNEENEFYEKQKVCHICKEEFVLIKMMKIQLNYTIKLQIIVITPKHLEELLIIFAI